ncbi:hypothetical protein RIR_jg16854.t1 [Rhizophagus irregularis DAOM 181602=DAOM 197198]|nr:hypothetical protein RIR_jg16854.t1 [Rhizophagus irregularis DAOM 181602=DAOM 197198]
MNVKALFTSIFVIVIISSLASVSEARPDPEAQLCAPECFITRFGCMCKIFDSCLIFTVLVALSKLS